jgi:hypothetical protein
LLTNDNVFTVLPDQTKIKDTDLKQLVEYTALENRICDFSGLTMPSQTGTDSVQEFDRAGPVPVLSFQHDNNDNGRIDTIVVRFSEALDVETINLERVKAQFAVNGQRLITSVDIMTDSAGRGEDLDGTGWFTYDGLPAYGTSTYDGDELARPKGIIDPGLLKDEYITIFTTDADVDSLRGTEPRQINFQPFSGTFQDRNVAKYGNPANSGIGEKVLRNLDYARPMCFDALQLDGGSAVDGLPDGYIDDVVLTFTEAIRDTSFFGQLDIGGDTGGNHAARWTIGYGSSMTSFDGTTQGTGILTTFDDYFDPHQIDDKIVTVSKSVTSLNFPAGTDKKSMAVSQSVGYTAPTHVAVAGLLPRGTSTSTQASTQLLRYPYDFPNYDPDNSSWRSTDIETRKLALEYPLSGYTTRELITGVSVIAVSNECLWQDYVGIDQPILDSRFHKLPSEYPSSLVDIIIIGTAEYHTIINSSYVRIAYDPQDGTLSYNNGTRVQVRSLTEPQMVILPGPGDYLGNNNGGETDNKFMQVWVDPAMLPRVDNDTATITNWVNIFGYGDNQFIDYSGRNALRTTSALPESDGAAPALLQANFFDGDGDGSIDEVVLKFSEPIDDSTFSASDVGQFGLDLDGDGVVDVYFNGLDDLSDSLGGRFTTNTLDPGTSPMSDIAIQHDPNRDGNHADDRILVSDTGNRRIVTFDMAGNTLNLSYIAPATSPLVAPKGIAYRADAFPLELANFSGFAAGKVNGVKFIFALDPVRGLLRKYAEATGCEVVDGQFPVKLNVGVASTPALQGGAVFVNTTDQKVVKVNGTSGSVDATFVANFSGFTVLDIETDGTALYVAVASAAGEGAVAKCNLTSGSLVTAFGTNGVVAVGNGLTDI